MLRFQLVITKESREKQQSGDGRDEMTRATVDTGPNPSAWRQWLPLMHAKSGANRPKRSQLHRIIGDMNRVIMQPLKS